MFKTIEYLNENYEANVMKKVPITDKFRLVEYIKLMGKVNDVYKSGGMEAVKSSEYYHIDKTLHLFLSWVDSGISNEMIGDLLKFYIYNFEDSDVYVSYLIALGISTMMISEGVDTPSLMSFLISMLGEEFLKSNYLRIFKERNIVELSEDKVIKLKYKDFDFTYRKLKYDLLAILKMSKESDGKELRKLVFKVYPNEELKVFFSLLDVESKKMSEILYQKMMKDSPKMDRFLLTASRCLIMDLDIIEMHYLLNSIIGKLTNFYKPYSEVMDEITMRENEIKAIGV